VSLLGVAAQDEREEAIGDREVLDEKRRSRSG
jgi:hypothetical protein